MSTHRFAIERVDIVSNRSLADVVRAFAGNVPRFVIGALAILVAAVSTGCGRASSEAWERKIVIAEQVSTRSQHSGRLFAAVVKPRIESTQSFRSGGRIVARLVDVGDAVSKDQVLATLDASDWALNAHARRRRSTSSSISGAWPGCGSTRWTLPISLHNRTRWFPPALSRRAPIGWPCA